ncbi:MAG: AtpZ/AtpI family protein [Patescibacteria group bacterium]|nr:AtpZ/AtpI family protein [Patescibacteria group bacterium]MDD5490434.1 AtpZ/AtpI family protein [Patescibacteria group bacterium]
MSQLENKKPVNETAWWQPHLVLFFELSGWIVVPIIAAVYLGRWLDVRYNSEPWLFLVSVGVAFVISMFGIVSKTIKSMNKITEENKKDEHPDGTKKP